MAKQKKATTITRIPAQSSSRVAKKPRQGRLPGAEDEENDRLEALAEVVLEEQEKLTKQETVVGEAREALTKEMIHQSRGAYSHQGLTITCTKKAAKYSLRVRKEEKEIVAAEIDDDNVPF